MERFVSVACLVLMVAGVSACVAESSDTVGDGDGSKPVFSVEIDELWDGEFSIAEVRVDVKIT